MRKIKLLFLGMVLAMCVLFTGKVDASGTDASIETESEYGPQSRMGVPPVEETDPEKNSGFVVIVVGAAVTLIASATLFLKSKPKKIK